MERRAVNSGQIEAPAGRPGTGAMARTAMRKLVEWAAEGRIHDQQSD